MWQAIRKNNTEVFNTIVANNLTNLRESNAYNETALHLAVTQGNLEMSQALINRVPEIDIDAKDDVGFSPLHIACSERIILFCLLTTCQLLWW